MPVLHGGMAHIAELRLPAGRLAVQPTVGVGCARMCVVLTLLSMEVGPAIVITTAVLGTKTLLRGPGFDQRSVDRKMLVRQQRLDLRMA